MEEPTHKQFKILKEIENEGDHSIMKYSNDPDINEYWELVCNGYLRNLCVIFGAFDWRFKLTNKAEKYLQENS